MNCPRCPHHVRQGQIALDKKSIAYHDRCALKIKSVADISAYIRVPL